MGFYYQPPRHTQELKQCHIEARLAFSEMMLTNPAWLPLIHFSDESRFVLGDDKRWVWYRRDEENESAMRSTRKFPPSVMIFAVIGPKYKSNLLFVEGSIDKEQYIQNLEDFGFIKDLDERYGALQWIFMQDGAPCHTSQMAVDWIEENCDLLSDWPANSPDLNPIELLWAILKHAVSSVGPSTVDELKQVLQSAWKGISLDVVSSLCASFPRRLDLCVQEKGQSISKLLHLCGEKYLAGTVCRNRATDRPWLAFEEQIVYEFVRTRGSHWADLQFLLKDRSAKAIKDHWYTVLLK
jgi:hypothetical protein